MQIKKNIKKIFPRLIKKFIKILIFLYKYRFYPPPSWSDLSDYELLLDVIIKHKNYLLEGDFVEIGSFLGGGTYKLSKLLQRLKVNKKIYAIDIFNPNFDKTYCTHGLTMVEIYRKKIKGKNQYELYQKITRKCKNIITIVGNSMIIELPVKKIAFAFVDGNHDPIYVRNDFYLIWPKLVNNGIIAFDDYGYDLPQVTSTINKLIRENRQKIKKIWRAGINTIFIQKKTL